ncbi:L,D-transpeptidase family protein [Allosphingosinicella indica]|uniref:L,D-transpeptidase catalytic domain n=1 Tax=Allosphingosinicella indica TaxID=941907 RepID=A0A1X7FZ80_9SPHN|nr:L,D-transpeptidase family protein [Allosphingosinicella indica]SMF61430.1 L,D-transpeptidase catalytic domain [Allosphingosinicella indica]
MHIRRLAILLPLLASAAPIAAQQDPVGAGQIVPVAPPPPAMRPADPGAAPLVSPITVSWPKRDAEDLLAYVQRVGEEGLDPADYAPDALRQAIDGGDAARLDSVATQTFLKLSSDLALGHVRGDARIDWHIEDPDLNGNEQYAMMERAVQQHSVHDTLNALLPTHPQYQELKSVLAGTTDAAKRDKIRVNMDRWRWLPRDLGRKYVIVNVPAYSVALVEDGRVIARRRAVAGAVKTATPQLNATISGAIFNPWWEVPASINKEVAGKKGYVRVKVGENGFRYRQPPGPANALGKVKLVMPNPHAIYLHDTNAKGLFDKQMRAYSHGCIRTEDAIGFTGILLEDASLWDTAKINETLASGKTVQANLAAPIPVYITYFTAAAVADKNEVIAYSDIYGRDKPVATALADRSGVTKLAAN